MATFVEELRFAAEKTDDTAAYDMLRCAADEIERLSAVVVMARRVAQGWRRHAKGEIDIVECGTSFADLANALCALEPDAKPINQ